MTLTETGKVWGNLYKRYYFLNGTRITESHANYLLKNHFWEEASYKNIQSGWRKSWNIGPHLDSPSLLDHPDCA
jgi:hypothetical protein